MANVMYRLKIVYIGKTEFAPGMTPFEDVITLMAFLDKHFPAWTKFTLEVKR